MSRRLTVGLWGQRPFGVVYSLDREPGDDDTVPFVQRWISSDARTRLRYMEEPRLGATMVVADTDDVGGTARTLGAVLFFHDVDELYEDAERAATHDEGVRALFRLTAGICVATRMPTRARHLYQQYLAQDHWMTRRAAVQAVAYGRWPESLTMVEDVAARDPDGRVRSFAAVQVGNLRALPAGGGATTTPTEP